MTSIIFSCVAAFDLLQKQVVITHPDHNPTMITKEQIENYFSVYQIEWKCYTAGGGILAHHDDCYLWQLALKICKMGMEWTS